MDCPSCHSQKHEKNHQARIPRTSFIGALTHVPNTPKEYSDIHSFLDSVVGRKTWSAFISSTQSEQAEPRYAHNIPIPSSPSSPHPLATASSSSVPLSASALPPLVVPLLVSAGAGGSEGVGFEGTGAGACHETSICPTVGKLVPFAYPCPNSQPW